MGILSAEQVRIFVAVVDHGGFSSAARELRRNQSAISYAIQNLEAQLGIELFDRSGHRPLLTPAGAALLADARKATYSLDTMRTRAQAFSRGVEAELALSVDAFYPMEALAPVLAEFAQQFPIVKPTLHLELVGNALNLVLDGTCALGIISHPMSTREELEQSPLVTRVELAPYVGISHPLATPGARTDGEELAKHIQLILADTGGLSMGQEMAIFSRRCWQSNDLRAHHALMLTGVGWGFMPTHLVAGDVQSGRLLPLDIIAWPNNGKADVAMMLVNHQDAALGPAANWLKNRLQVPG